MERQCHQCWFSGFEGCWFKQEVDKIANNPNLTPEEKHIQIANLRIVARDTRLCPNNTYDPDYPGKEKL